MLNALTKGERICKSLQNPSSKDIAASEWLLLFTIYQNQNICLKDIDKKLSMFWERINKENSNFYILWSTGYEMEEELLRYKDIGILKITKWKDDEPCWSLTDRGDRVLNAWKNSVKELLGSIVQSR